MYGAGLFGTFLLSLSYEFIRLSTISRYPDFKQGMPEGSIFRGREWATGIPQKWGILVPVSGGSSNADSPEQAGPFNEKD